MALKNFSLQRTSKTMNSCTSLTELLNDLSCSEISTPQARLSCSAVDGTVLTRLPERPEKK